MNTTRDPAGKKRRRVWLQALAVAGIASIVIFPWFSWPLPLFWTEGLPSSAQNLENPAWRYAIPGDHLQLFYYFELVGDMLAGTIPWFHNVYEFNLGDDSQRFQPGAYFMPMSAMFALLYQGLQPAAAWNTVLALSVGLSAVLAWLWLRRFSNDPLVVLLGLAVVVGSPFRWSNLFGGSPAGLALPCVPLLALGIDHAMRRPSWLAGGWVGLAMLLSYWADQHIFYFNALVAPFYVLVSVAAPGRAPVSWRTYGRLLPGGGLFAVLILIYYRWRKSYLSGSIMAGGRAWEEVGIFSPSRRALLWDQLGVDHTAYLGWFTLLAVLGAAILVWRNRKAGTEGWRLVLLWAAGAALVVVALALGLGVNGPRAGWFLDKARAYLPYYGMIRQPTKIFAVLPMLLAWLLVVGWSSGNVRSWRKGLVVVLGMGILLELKSTVSATLCLLEHEQPAYKEVARRAGAQGETGRILVLPLWPGDSSETSLPMYLTQRHGLRMVNGYNPITSRTYVEQVFQRLESMNQGWVQEDQLAFLLERGIRYVLVHENQYPEQVGPFPVAVLLARLEAHPRLARVPVEGRVHLFEILPTEAAREIHPQQRSPVTTGFPARRWEAEALGLETGEIHADDQVSGGAFWTGEALVAAVAPALQTRTARIAPDQDMAWWLRVRGEGQLRAITHWGKVVLEDRAVAIRDAEWTWKVVSLPEATAYNGVALQVEVDAGRIDVDTILLVKGTWPVAPWPQETVVLPAAHFFRAGYTLPDGESVVLHPDYEPDRIVFYGPRLPLPIGEYRLTMSFTSPAPQGTELARVRMVSGAGSSTPWMSLISGHERAWSWSETTGVPVSLELSYTRQAPVILHAVHIANAPPLE